MKLNPLYPTTGILLLSVALSCTDHAVLPSSSLTQSREFSQLDVIRQPPVVNSVIPGTGPVGETIVINGANFSGTIAYNTVSFNGTAAVITEATPSRLVVTVPANANSGNITVTSDGFVTQSNNFQVILANTWQERSRFANGVERRAAVAFAINGKGYIGTGLEGFSSKTKDFWEYDPKTNVWTQKADFGGTARAGAAGFSIGSKGYIGTGSGSGYYKDFWEYDPTANTWTRKADFPGAGRQLAASFSVGNQGFIGTGTSGSTYYKDFYMYNQDFNTWTRIADFGGVARYRTVSFPIGVKGYVGGGTGSGTHADFWEYHLPLNQWTRKADIPGPQPTTGFGSNLKGFVGMHQSSTSFREYDPATNQWRTRAEFPGGGRFLGCSFVIGDWGYFAIGSDANTDWPYGAPVYRYIVK
jgi:N-acetylneuraminic acid mutarotase